MAEMKERLTKHSSIVPLPIKYQSRWSLFRPREINSLEEARELGAELARKAFNQRRANRRTSKRKAELI